MNRKELEHGILDLLKLFGFTNLARYKAKMGKMTTKKLRTVQSAIMLMRKYKTKGA
jgi:hypothetical protein